MEKRSPRKGAPVGRRPYEARKKPLAPVHSFPMRINKYLAWKGYSSRRGADELILSGKVTLNGKPAVLGDKVHESDQVELGGDSHKTHLYYLLNKTRGVAVDELIHKMPQSLFAIEPMEKLSSGVILCTNDGRIIREQMSKSVTSEYSITFSKPLTSSFLKILSVGAEVEKKKFPRIEVKQTDADTAFVKLAGVTLHGLQYISTHFGFEITSSERLKYGPFTAQALPSGTWRELTEKEKAYIPSIFGVKL